MGRRACNALKLPNQHSAKHSPAFSARCSESHAMAVPNFQIWNDNSVTISNSKSISDSKATSNIQSRFQHNLKFKEPLNSQHSRSETNNSNPKSTSSCKAFSTQNWKLTDELISQPLKNLTAVSIFTPNSGLVLPRQSKIEFESTFNLHSDRKFQTRLKRSLPLPCLSHLQRNFKF